MADEFGFSLSFLPYFLPPFSYHFPSNRSVEVVKIMMLGDPQVGKTSLLLRYIDRTFTDKYISTLGVDFKQRQLNVQDKSFQIQVWDTAGQERLVDIEKEDFFFLIFFFFCCY